MDAATIISILGGLATAAASAFGVLKWIGGYRAKLVLAQNIAKAAEIGSQAAYDLLGDIIAVSDKNSLTKADIDQFVANATEPIPTIRLALKIGTLAPVNPAAIAVSEASTVATAAV